ncbi:MAG: patatin-like phospholipase family protein [Candidatus Pacebacteria bacterium]|nr:patatin-like phospholipase family protein [Candidatus Paceibacterota bacterium]
MWLFFCLLTHATLGAWTRDTRRDHAMQGFTPPRVDLSRYQSVQTRPDQHEDLALAVAISGGGHRAGNFAAGVLLALEEFTLDNGKPVNLLNEVDYFSTVSGGGFPVAVYLSTRMDYGDSRSYSFRDALSQADGRYLKNLRRDYQITLLEAAVTPKCIGFHDAGDLLEETFDDFLLGASYRAGTRSLTLNDIFRPKESGAPVTLPYWFANATIYENGCRFVFTPGLLREYDVKACTHRFEEVDLTADPGRMPLAVGLKTSASFPVLIPATTFTCRDTVDPLNPYLHLVDGGLVDNQGIYTAFEVLRQDSAKHKILLVIDAYKGISQPRSQWQASPSGPEMAIRIMKIALDSARNRLEQTLVQQQRLAEAGGVGTPIHVALISFGTLKPETVRRFDDLEQEVEAIRKQKVRGFMRRVQREFDSLVGSGRNGGEEDAEDIPNTVL